MKIIIDAMGGDNAPAAIVQGAVDAQREFGVDIVLVGIEEQVRACLADCGVSGADEHITVVNATEVVDMHDDPSTACRRKKDSSMTVGLNMLRDGAGDAMVSAGSTGALLTGATLLVKRIRGIRRASFCPTIPNGKKGVVLIDCGANVDCTPEYLLQFAYMGSFYAKNINGVDSPRVGLLNNGSEESKGTELCKTAYALLAQAHDEGRINFVGNIEGHDVFADKVDVIVTDGFTGNILMKTIEGSAKFLMKQVKGVMYKSLKNKLAALVIKKDFGTVKDLLNVDEVGGTPFLGINRPVIKAHGNSNARAIRSAIMQAIRIVEADITGEIERNIEFMKLRAED